MYNEERMHFLKVFIYFFNFPKLQHKYKQNTNKIEYT